MPTKFCNRPGCSELVPLGIRLCQGHQARNYQQQDQARENATDRGYDADWRRFRSWFKSKYPLCADCLAENRLTVTEEVHHLKKLRDYPELRLVESNCRALCNPHHSARTRKGE